MDKVSLNGVEIFPFDSEQQLLHYVDTHKGILVAINAEKILHATEQTRAIINRNIGYCDGAGAQMALKQKGYKDACKIPGCELWLKIITRFYKEKTFYLVGGKPQIVNETVEKLCSKYQDIRIVGYRNGYIKTDEEKRRLIDDIVEKKPDVVFVAMGSPKQELLMEEIQQRHRAIFQGLGGSFDVYTGHVQRAPKWWVEHNLEFAYRLIKEPKRIKRQIHLVKYAWWLMKKNYKQRIYEESDVGLRHPSGGNQDGSAGERIPETAKTGRDCGVRNRTASGNAGSGVEDIRHQTGL